MTPRCGRGLGAPDQGQQQPRGQVAQDVAHDRRRRAHRGNQRPREAGAGDLRGGTAGLQGGVARNELISLDQRRQVGRGGDLSADVQDADEEEDQVEGPQGEMAEHERDGER